MQFIRTTAINKILSLSKRIKILQGGMSAGKTFGVLPILIDKAMKIPGLRIDVVSCTYNHLETGAIADFKSIMLSTKRWNEDCWHDTKHKYNFINGSYIRFIALDKPGKARGPRRDILYVNECNLIPFETYLNLEDRTNLEIFLDYNPTNEFWVHKEVMHDSDSEMIILTFKDNEALHPNIVKKILKMKEKAITSKYWENRWKVYGLGLVGKLEGAVFDDIEQIPKLPQEARLIGYGMDFGYNDPTALIAVYEYKDTIILDEVLYKSKLTPEDIIKHLKELHIDPKSEIYADNSSPGIIEEIRRNGFNIKPVDKGQDSIMLGIGLMQQRTLYVTSRSENLLKEFDNYVWAKDTDGNPTNKPVDKWNHAIDSVRYLFRMKLDSKPIADKPVASIPKRRR